MRALLLGILLAACGGNSKPATSTPSPTGDAAPLSNTAPATPAQPAPSPAHAAHASGKIADVLATMRELTDDMCKCVDRACTEQVTDRMTRWGQEMAQTSASQQDKITEADTKDMATITERMTQCMTKILAPAAGSAAP